MPPQEPIQPQNVPPDEQLPPRVPPPPPLTWPTSPQPYNTPPESLNESPASPQPFPQPTTPAVAQAPSPQPLPPVASQPVDQLPPHTDSLEKTDPDERQVAIIRRHPFGILLLYFQVGIGIAAAIALIYFLLPSAGKNSDAIIWWLKLGGFVVVLLLVALLVIATIIYRKSRLIVTNKSITQILQEGLINHRVSQLSIVDIEDVTANKRGFFATILNFGLLMIETAGEVENFEFKYCPNPSYYAKIILEERQHYVETQGE